MQNDDYKKTKSQLSIQFKIFNVITQPINQIVCMYTVHMIEFVINWVYNINALIHKILKAFKEAPH